MELSTDDIIKLVLKYYPYLKENEVDIFLSISEYLAFNSKEIILKKGRTDKNIFLILEGDARAYSITEDGHEITHHLRSGGFIFGDPKVFGDGPQALDIEAISEIHILKFDISELENIGYNDPEIMKFYIKLLKEIILVFSHRIDTFVAMTAKERYLDLIRWNPTYLKSTFDKHIASFLGIRPLTLSRIKNKKY